MKKDKNGLTEKEFLQQYKIEEYERPSVTVDNLLFAIDEIINDDIKKLNEKRLQVLLVKRIEHPYLDMWSLPGTFVKFGETLEEASNRCLNIKTHLNDLYLEQLYTFGDINRDPRTRIMSVSYMSLMDKKHTNIADEKGNTSWFTIKTSRITNDGNCEIVFDNGKGIVLKAKIKVDDDNIKVESSDLAFDHAKIIFYGLTRLRNKLEYTDIAFNMLSNRFTMVELQQVYETILDRKLTKANFQRKIKDKIHELDEYKTGGFRPAKLYKYKKNDDSDSINDELNKVFNEASKKHHIVNTAYPLTPISFMQYKLKGNDYIKKSIANNINASDELSIYIHIPFCKTRCGFCEYAVVSGDEANEKTKYIDYLIKEMDMYKDIIGNKKIVGFDIGGGTPSILETADLKRIVDYVKTHFNLSKDLVISIETTPPIASNELDKLKAIKELGIDRISMGIQTISEKLLNEFGREGNAHIYESAMNNLRTAGFEKINIDIMYGFLNQSLEDFRRTIEYAIKLNPEYITLYKMRYKLTKISDEAKEVSLEKVNKQYEVANQLLNEHGFDGNYGKNTFSRVKNDYGTSDYLTGRVIRGTDYIGFGLGAQTFIQDYIAYNEGAATKSLKTYFEKIDKNILPLQDIYNLPKDETMAKMICVAFYFCFLDLDMFYKRFKIKFEDYFKDEIKFLKEKQLIDFRDNKMFINKSGDENLSGIISMFYSQRSRDELFKLKDIF